MCGDSVPVPHVEEAAGPALRAEHLGLRRQRIAQAAQHQHAAIEPDQRVGARALEQLRQPLHAQIAQAGGVDLQRMRRIA